MARRTRQPNGKKFTPASSHGHLAEINPDLFYPGIHIPCGIYYCYKSTYVMLCCDVDLTEEMIERMREISAFQQGIFVEASYCDEILSSSIKYHEELFEVDDKSEQTEKKKTKRKGKPFTAEEVKRLERTKKQYGLIITDAVAMMGEIGDTDKIELQTATEITNMVADLVNNVDDTIVVSCVNEIRQMDDSLYTHSIDVAVLNGLISKWMSLTPEQTHKLIRIGLLHDLGKLKIPPEVLNKPARLTSEEFDIIKMHATYSYDILTNSGETDVEVLTGVRGHHERIDGTGYPDDLKSNEIPFFARISAVSDVYDAMISKRVYKRQSSPFEVLDEFSKRMFTHLDRTIVEVFLENMPRELVGRAVSLSTGETGIVVYVSPLRFAFPIVRVGNRLVATNEDCYCVSVNSVITDKIAGLEKRNTDGVPM
ncbi:MAG: HD-GYP domain-containing protein [Hydrogenoanaerobacterium sp.]